MSQRPVALLAALLLLLPGAASGRAALTPPAAGELQASVEALAAPELNGRRSGTPGGELAARRIADWLAAAGLRPGGDGGTWFQSFVISELPRVAPTSALEALTPGTRRFTVGSDWTPHGGSPSGGVTGEIAFAGHGVVAPERGWDDYAGVDVSGKIVLVLDGAPPHLPGRVTSRLEKLIAARQRGAQALLIVAERLPMLSATGAAFGLISGALTTAAADALLAPAGRTITALAKTTADTRAPAPLATPVRARLSVALGREMARGLNVIGILPGANPVGAPEAIVLGAHYDHLGEIGGAVHPGADDNASGTAVVVGLARAFAAARGVDRTLVFILFGGEELGLLGSGHYVRNPAVPLDSTVAMLNFDQVGRMRDDRLFVGGVDSASLLRDVVSDAARATGTRVELSGSPYTPSDHSRFYAAGSPVLFFYTGGHRDHHQSSDTPDKINAAGMAAVADLAARVVQALGTSPRPAWAKVAPSPRHRAGPGPVSGATFLGVGADARTESDGVRLAEVFPDSAAARAGLRDGDVIVRVGDTPVNSFDGLRAVIRARRPGETVHVVYLRAGDPHVTSATLGARP